MQSWRGSPPGSALVASSKSSSAVLMGIHGRLPDCAPTVTHILSRHTPRRYMNMYDCISCAEFCCKSFLNEVAQPQQQQQRIQLLTKQRSTGAQSFIANVLSTPVSVGLTPHSTAVDDWAQSVLRPESTRYQVSSRMPITNKISVPSKFWTTSAPGHAW